MTRPIQEPSTPRAIRKQKWDSVQLKRRGITDDWVYVGLFVGPDNAGNDQGTLGNGTHWETDPLSPPFQNSWVNEDPTWPLRFRWHHFLTGVELDGAITGGTPPSIVFTLPPGQWLPEQLQRFLTPSGTAGSVAVWEIDPSTGDVSVLAIV